MRANMDWVDEQLTAVGYTGIGAARVRELVATLSDSNFSQTEKDEVEKVVDMAKNLFLGIAIADPDSDVLDGTWTQAERGYIAKKDTVRVKPEAYLGEAGIRHNGKAGRVTGVSGDNITVIYVGESLDSAASHNLNNLLKKM